MKYTNYHAVFTNYGRLNYLFLGLGWILYNNIIFANFFWGNFCRFDRTILSVDLILTCLCILILLFNHADCNSLICYLN